jgi:hypothetical protein
MWDAAAALVSDAILGTSQQRASTLDREGLRPAGVIGEHRGHRRTSVGLCKSPGPFGLHLGGQRHQVDPRLDVLRPNSFGVAAVAGKGGRSAALWVMSSGHRLCPSWFTALVASDAMDRILYRLPGEPQTLFQLFPDAIVREVSIRAANALDAIVALLLTRRNYGIASK